MPAQLKARKEASLRQVLIRSEGNNASSKALIDKVVNRGGEMWPSNVNLYSGNMCELSR